MKVDSESEKICVANGGLTNRSPQCVMARSFEVSQITKWCRNFRLAGTSAPFHYILRISEGSLLQTLLLAAHPSLLVSVLCFCEVFSQSCLQENQTPSWKT